MKLLGVDYGRKKLGFALADNFLADPFKVVRIESFDEALGEVAKVVKLEQIEKVIVGISEGEMGKESKEFSLSLRLRLKIPVETFDETLSTQEAQKLAIEAGIRRSKRKFLEDAFAAAVMLQSYLDSHV